MQTQNWKGKDDERSTLIFVIKCIRSQCTERTDREQSLLKPICVLTLTAPDIHKFNNNQLNQNENQIHPLPLITKHQMFSIHCIDSWQYTQQNRLRLLHHLNGFVDDSTASTERLLFFWEKDKRKEWWFETLIYWEPESILIIFGGTDSPKKVWNQIRIKIQIKKKKRV